MRNCVTDRCHNINVVALTPTCLSMWKTCPTSDPITLSPTLIPSASSQIHQTSLLGTVSQQVSTLLSCLSSQPGECQQVWFHHGGGWRVRRHYRGVRQAMTPSLRSWINFWVFTVGQAEVKVCYKKYIFCFLLNIISLCV